MLISLKLNALVPKSTKEYDLTSFKRKFDKKLKEKLQIYDKKIFI